MVDGCVTVESLWNKIKCFFGYHLWLEEWPDDWPRVPPRGFNLLCMYKESVRSRGEPIHPWFDRTVPRMETEEDFKKKGWTRRCLNCGKVQKREEWR